MRQLISAQIQRLTQEGKEKLREEKRLQASVYLAKAYQLEQSINANDKALDDLLIQASLSLTKELQELKVGGKDRHSDWVSFRPVQPGRRDVSHDQLGWCGSTLESEGRYITVGQQREFKSRER